MRSRILAAIAALTLPVTLLAAPANADVQRTTAAVFPADVIGEDFPDPDVFEKNGTWYAYSTNNGRGHVPVATASSPNGPWTIRGDAMPGGPSASWAKAGRTWAPDVYPNPDGSFTLTYTAWHKASGRQCIGVATAGSALGPFTPVGTQPLICPLDQGGAIDANTFVANDGTRYLAWKNDGNALGQPSTLWLTRTTNNGTSLTGGNTAMLTASGVIEAPDLVQRESQFVLFYSSGGYTDCNYQTWYATSPSLNGPWTKAAQPLMTTATMDNHVCGPGGADFVGNDWGGGAGNESSRVFLHGWVNGSRHLYVADLGWANDFPVVRGSRLRTEAERGTLNHCSVRTGAAGASGGAVAAYIDYADSWVQVSVFAPSAGGYTLWVGYANGMGATASHGVVVNGNSQGSVSYPASGWDNWRQTSIPITLNAGWNTIRLTKGTLYAEVDYLELQ